MWFRWGESLLHVVSSFLTLCSLRLLEVCMMTQRTIEPHEAPPMNLDLWSCTWECEMPYLWQRLPAQKLLPRCPWIARLIFRWVCLWVCKADGCRRVWAETRMHHECTGLYLSEDRLHALVWSLLGQWGLCQSEKVSVTHLSSCFPLTRLLCH